MRGEEIRNDFIRIERTDGSVEIHVLRIGWDGQIPVDRWELAVTLNHPVNEFIIQREIEKIFDRKRYFKTCDDCGERNPSGWMDGRICHECQEKQGVVF